MDFKNLFTNFNGRIGRQSFWIGTISTIVASLILQFIVSSVLGVGMMEYYSSKAAWAQLIVLLIIAYPVTALMAKRLNDRDRPSWMKWVFWAPTVLSVLLGLTGAGYSMTDMGGVMVPAPSTLMTVLSLLSMAVGLWALVELGILRGTQGPNQHGPDPVAG